jgi:hypothetical protein
VNITEGATLTGGSSVTLSPAGILPGRSSFVGPGHTRLEPETVEFSVSGGNPGATKPGTAKTGVKITFASRLAEEGCCTVTPGAVVANLGITWDLTQPDSLVDELIARLRAVVYHSSFPDMVKKGILPST